MDKIKTKAAAMAIAEMFVAEDPKFERMYCPGYNAEKPWLRISEKFDPGDFENPNTNECIIMIFIRTDKDHYDRCRPHLVAFYNDCSGGEWHERLSTSEIADKIWKNRKYINCSKQLNKL